MQPDPEPTPPGAGAPTQSGSAPGSPSGRGRLRPPPAATTHTPLLLGIDTTGAEHPQGPNDPDDDTLSGRVWGCTCGWRGTVRDVSARHFRPRVGDGGRLRRQRLARSDRNARPELEAHLTVLSPPLPLRASTPTTASPPTPAIAVDGLQPSAPARTRRRRLTLPRTDPAGAPAPALAALGDDPSIRDGPAGAAGPTRDPGDTHDSGSPDRESGGLAGWLEPGPSSPRAGAPGLPRVAEQEPGGGEEPLTGPAPVATSATGNDTAERTLAAAADRARVTRVELAAAEEALEAAVTAARASGASWRTIARITGVAHREAAARWSHDPGGPSL